MSEELRLLLPVILTKGSVIVQVNPPQFK